MLLWSPWLGQSLGEPQHLLWRGLHRSQAAGRSALTVWTWSTAQGQQGAQNPEEARGTTHGLMAPMAPSCPVPGRFCSAERLAMSRLRAACYLSHPWPSPSGHVLWLLLGVTLNRGSSHLCPRKPPLTWAGQAPFSVTLCSHTQVRHPPFSCNQSPVYLYSDLYYTLAPPGQG